jgi:hypothetical protein
LTNLPRVEFGAAFNRPETCALWICHDKPMRRRSGVQPPLHHVEIGQINNEESSRNAAESRRLRL